jgi:PRTRC genetic system protein A
MMTDVIDGLIQDACPLVAAPQSGRIERPDKQGTRIIAACDGLYREVSTPWLYSVLPASAGALQGCTPYGQVTPCAQLLCGPVPVALVSEFLALAQQALPNESAALIVWNTEAGTWRLAPRLARFASADRIDYEEPALGEAEVRVVDIHSHGRAKAFFSNQDDADDAGAIKISVVIGCIDRQTEIVARLMVVQQVVPLQMKPDGEFVIAETRP